MAPNLFNNILELGYDLNNLYKDDEDEIYLQKKSEFERETELEERRVQAEKKKDVYENQQKLLLKQTQALKK